MPLQLGNSSYPHGDLIPPALYAPIPICMLIKKNQKQARKGHVTEICVLLKEFTIKLQAHF